MAKTASSSDLLHRHAVLLPLPADERRAVIFDGQLAFQWLVVPARGLFHVRGAGDLAAPSPLGLFDDDPEHESVVIVDELSFFKSA